MHRCLLLAFALLLAATPGCAPLPPAGGVDVSTGSISDQWTVRWDAELGTPSSMTNRSLQDVPASRASVAASDTVAEAAVRAVFWDRRDWFRLRSDLDGIRVVRSYREGWLRYMRVVQTYRGIPVAGATYEARVLPNGRVGSLEGRFYPDLHLDVTPVLSAFEAEDRARALYAGGSAAPPSLPALLFEFESGFSGPRVLTLVPQGRQPVLAWGVMVQASPGQYARVYVSATNGATLGGQMLGSVDPR